MFEVTIREEGGSTAAFQLPTLSPELLSAAMYETQWKFAEERAKTVIAGLSPERRENLLQILLTRDIGPIPGGR